jgi:hypothetical protein
MTDVGAIGSLYGVRSEGLAVLAEWLYALNACSCPDAVPGRYVICGMEIQPDEGLLGR